MTGSAFYIHLDEVTLARAKRGDLRACETIYRSYQVPAYTIAVRVCSCRELARDVTQEAFINAFKRLPQFRGEAPFWGWLRRVAPEVREPLTWQSVVRLRSVPAAPASPSAVSAPSATPAQAVGASPTTAAAPSAPSAPSAPTSPDDNVWFERIEVQEIDREALAAQIARMEVEIAQRGGPANSTSHGVSGDTEGYELYFGDMSELGDFALTNTSAWYGMPLTSGLRLAKVEPELGEYFNTDRGVLVLKAKQDNALLLQAGDVVLSLHGTEVNSPADFMRALREFEPGDELKIDIKRKRKNQTLSPVISDKQVRFFAPQDIPNFQVIVSNSGL